jgi:Trk K+ transport system NAD-binding subunit
VTQRDLLGAFDSEVLKHNRLLARVRTVGEGEGEVDYLELPEKHRLVEVAVPAAIEGRTVAESALRSRYGVSVLAVKRRARDGGERRFVPEPSDRFARGDVLVVLGSDEAIARLREGEPLPVLTGP